MLEGAFYSGEIRVTDEAPNFHLKYLYLMKQKKVVAVAGWEGEKD